MHSTRVWHLLGRKLTGDATLEELQELERYLLADAELASNADLHAAYFEADAGDSDHTQYKPCWEKQQQRLQREFPGDFGVSDGLKKSSVGKMNQGYVWIAAAVLVICGLFIWTTYMPDKRKLAGENEMNEKRRLTLPDGTLVWLNKNSTISYNKEFGIHNREIVLSGEAFFDVVHKAELPMTIHAGLVNIKVKGTAFNVAAYPGNDKIETSLIRGLIELSVKDKPGQRGLMKPNEKITITYDSHTNRQPDSTPDIRLEVDPLITETQTGLIPEVAWIENKLVFSNEPFISVVEKMGRWYDVRLVVMDKELAGEKFTGVFDKETLEQALTALQMTYDFKYKKDAERTIIISKN